MVCRSLCCEADIVYQELKNKDAEKNYDFYKRASANNRSCTYQDRRKKSADCRNALQGNDHGASLLSDPQIKSIILFCSSRADYPPQHAYDVAKYDRNDHVHIFITPRIHKSSSQNQGLHPSSRSCNRISD